MKINRARKNIKIFSLNILKILLIIILCDKLYNMNSDINDPLKAAEYFKTTIVSIFTHYKEGGVFFIPYKMFLVSLMSIIIFPFSISLGINILNGLNKMIRNKSNNIDEYIKNTSILLLKTTIIEILIFIFSAIAVLFWEKAPGILEINTCISILQILLFYPLIPIILLFLVEKVEFYLVSMLLIFNISTLFISFISIQTEIMLILILIIITYFKIIVTEDRK